MGTGPTPGTGGQAPLAAQPDPAACDRGACEHGVGAAASAIPDPSRELQSADATPCLKEHPSYASAGWAAGTEGLARKNLVLTGFMATGKTSVGRLAAERLGMPFVDLDALIEARLGAPIPAIFRERGEAFFRDAETAAAREAGQLRGAVIATGGGAFLRPENRAALAHHGVVICLWADPETIARRIADAAARPMLQTVEAAEPLVERARRLLAARRPIYAAIPLQVDTSRLSLEAVVEQVTALYRRETGVA